jgi:hypothetical protein
MAETPMLEWSRNHWPPIHGGESVRKLTSKDEQTANRDQQVIIKSRYEGKEGFLDAMLGGSWGFLCAWYDGNCMLASLLSFPLLCENKKMGEWREIHDQMDEVTVYVYQK